MELILIYVTIAKALQCYPSAPLRVLFNMRSLSGAEMNRTFAITSIVNFLKILWQSIFL